jgi:hypothetical protein
MTTTARSSAPAPGATLTRFPAARIRSLVWDADALVDWVDGGVRWTLQGQSSDPAVRYAFSFDMATTLPGSGYSVIYKRLGTKGLVLKDGRIVREIDRSYYHAEAYEFPVALFRLPSGRPAIVHCPEDYCRLRIDDLETGEVITTATDAAGDFFHSRLSVSSDGRWLASAGWMWHPVDDVAVYDLHVALTDGRALDSATRELDVLTDSGNAAGFDRRNRLVVTGDLFGSDWRGDDSEPAAPGGPCVVRIAPGSGNPAERIAVDADSAFMAVGDDHLLLLGGHPRLLSIASGQVVAEWPDIKTTVPASALQSGEHAWTPFAFDVAGARIAIAHDDQLTVIAFDVPALD